MGRRIFKAWFDEASKEKRAKLAKLAGTSVNALWQFSSDKGHRNASAKKAAEIEDAAVAMGEPIRRGDVCETCNACPYYRAKVDNEDLFD